MVLTDTPVPQHLPEHLWDSRYCFVSGRRSTRTGVS